MKKWFAFSAIFLTVYSVFLIATIPANYIIGNVNLPKNISVNGVTGTIWQGQIEQIRLGNTRVEKTKFELNFWSLLALHAKLNLTFGDPMLAGPEGELVLTVSQDFVELNDAEILMTANEIAQQLTLPLPITAQGDVSLILPEVTIALPYKNECISVNGHVDWLKAGVVALDQNIKLGKLIADITCEKGLFTAKVSPQNNLGLTFRARIEKTGRLSGQGYMKPGSKFPKQLKSTLPFLGRQDNQGRYALRL